VGILLSVVIFLGIIVLMDAESEISIVNPLNQKLDDKQLFANYRESMGAMCYVVSSLENIGTCNTMDAIAGAFETTFPNLNSDHTFDSKYCEKVNDNIGLLYKSLYDLNTQDLTYMNDDEFREHMTGLVLEKYNLNEYHYDVMHDFVKSTDELYLFWEQAWLNSC